MDESSSKGKKRFEKMEKFFVLALATIIFLSFLVFWAVCIWRECGHAKEAVIGYLVTKTNNEQIQHVAKVRKTISEIEDVMYDLGSYVFIMESGQRLDLEDKKQYLTELRKVEENAILLEEGYMQYFNDYSIQYSPFADGRITSEIYEAKNLSIALQRFVRQSEMVLFGTAGREQGSLLAEQFYEIVWFVEDAKNGFQ